MTERWFAHIRDGGIRLDLRRAREFLSKEPQARIYLHFRRGELGVSSERKLWGYALATPMPTFVDTGTVVVDKNNLKLYREALAPHPKPL